MRFGFLLELVTRVYEIDIVAFEVREHNNLCCMSEHDQSWTVCSARRRPS